MATPNIVPRADSEGQLGTSSKYWGAAYIDLIYVGAGKIGRDADNLLDFSADNHLTLRLNANNKLVFDGARMYPNSNDGYGLGIASNAFSDLFLASGAVINFNNGDVTLTHGSGQVDFSGGNLVLSDNSPLFIGSGGDGKLESSSDDFIISQTTADKDLIFKADDGSGSATAYLTLDGVEGHITVQKEMHFQNNILARFGTNNASQIYHSGSVFQIDNNAGDFNIVQNTDDGSIYFKADNDSGGLVTYFQVDGNAGILQAHKDLYALDNVKLIAGNGGDLKIYHDGSNSYIQSSGTGDVIIEQRNDDKDIVFNCDDGSGGVTEYFRLDGSSATHDGSATTGLYTNWPDNSRISLGTSHDFSMRHDGTNTVLNNNTGDLYFMQSADDKDIIFQSDNGSGGLDTYFIVDGGSHTIDFFKQTHFYDNVKATFGAGNDLQIHHNGTNTFIDNSTGNLVIQNTFNDGDIKFKSDDGSGGVTDYMYLDGSVGFNRFPYPVIVEDSVNFNLGTGQDFQLLHNGTDSIMRNATGDLYIQQNADDKGIIFQSDDGSGGTETYFFLAGSLDTDYPATVFPDASRLYFGTGYDLNINHNGINSFISNNTGDLEITQSADDKDIVFSCDDGSGGNTPYLTLDGGNVQMIATVKLAFNDSVRTTYGNSSDLQIYHDGTNSNITNSTGGLFIDNYADDADTYFRNDDGAGGIGTYFFLDGSQATHDGSATTALVTQWPDNSKIYVGTGGDGRFFHDGSHTYLQNTTGDLIIQNFHDDGDIIFKSDDGSGGTTEYFRIDGGANLNKFFVNSKHLDNVKAIFGDSDDLQIYHDGSHSYIDDAGTGNLKLRGNAGVQIMKAASTEIMGEFIADGAVNLYHNNVKKFETTATGISVTGGLTTTSTVVLSNLPTSDPGSTGQLWNDSGTLKISAG